MRTEMCDHCKDALTVKLSMNSLCVFHRLGSFLGDTCIGSKRKDDGEPKFRQFTPALRHR